MIIQLNNFDLFKANPMAKLPHLESMRAKLFMQLWQKEEGSYTIDIDLENSTGKILSVLKDTKVTPLTQDQIKSLCLEAGFSSVNFYANYKMEELTPESPNIVAVIS